LTSDVDRLRDLHHVEGGSTRLVGKKVKATSHHRNPAEIMDYVYYGVLLGETDLTWVVLTGYTKVTMMKENTVLEPWEE